MEYAYLRVKTAEGEKPVELGSAPLTMGRHESNALVIKDTMASRFHCVIEKSGGGYFLRDLQSRNGTLVNGQRVMNAPLKTGDVIRIGEVEMKIILHHVSKSLAGKHAAEEVGGAEGAGRGNAVGKRGAAVAGGDSVDDLEVVETPAVPAALEVDDPAQIPFVVLRRAAEAMPDRTHEIESIALVSPRGTVMHEGGGAGAKGRGGGAGPAGGDAVMLLRLILLVCFRTHASDIHLEPRDGDFLLRIRMDGNLLDVTDLSQDLGQRLTALVKVLSELDMTQRNIVQEGHFASTAPQAGTPAAGGGAVGAAGGMATGKNAGAAVGGGGGVRRVDYRVSFVPSLHGQKMVIRVFDMANAPQTLENLHLPKSVEGRMERGVGTGGGIDSGVRADRIGEDDDAVRALAELRRIVPEYHYD